MHKVSTRTKWGGEKTNFDEESENKPRETVHSLEFTVADKTFFLSIQ